MFTLLPQLLLGIVFLTIVFLHLSRKNGDAVAAYGIQSLAIAGILLGFYFETRDSMLLLVVALTFIVKVLLAPRFLNRLIKKHGITFSASTFLNLPLTLGVIAVLVFVAQSEKLETFTSIVPFNHNLLVLALAGMLLSLFLIVNRKGALSQIIGVLSLENSIIAFALFAGLEQSSALQIGIIFDIFVWFNIATVFAGMIYRHFGSLDVTAMQKLKD